MPEKKPTRTADLDYFYGQSSELFSFYRIPKLLFQDSRFQPLSTDAKTLYGILLDRMSLSARNGWLDKAGRVFIIYTVQEVQDSLGCADKKATKLLRELEEYGLIERKRRGLGKPDLIYVKNFSSESSKTPYLNRDNDDSGTVQNTLQDPAKLRCNKTERNNTEVGDTDPISSDENDWMSEREQLEEYFSQALEVDLLLRLCPDDEDTMLIVQDAVWGRVTANRSAGKSTRYYADEFHLLLKEEQTAAYSVEIWKRFRKWGGIPTALTQNVKDLLASPEVSNIFENSDFVYMLNQANGDRQILAKQLNISPHQLSYVTHSGEGEGLLFFGNVILPFVDHFPKDLELYRILTTRLSEVAEAQKHE